MPDVSLPIVPHTAKRGILELSFPDLLAWLTPFGQPRMRARQILRWVLASRAESFDQMTNLPHDLRQKLAEEFVPLATQVDQHQVAKDGTCKLLVRLTDGQRVECVMIPDEQRRTACVSTQVGCGMGCVFCASGLDGVARNLTTGEILEQLVRLRNLLPAEERLSNIVVMGMGEPLANLENLLAALESAGDPESLHIGARHITISTVGLPAKIRKLADADKQYHLAVSLHAPNDALRNQIVPTNPQTGIGPILEAADYFFEKTGRQVTFEYVVLGGLNDDVTHARELGRLLTGRHAHINLIPFNEVEGLPYRRPSDQALNAFVDTLRRAGLSVKVRKRKGSEIDAACGQLRRKLEQDARPELPEIQRV